ncbi:MAG: gliding-motility protein MglA [Deltaproteobacteria bacterium]|nr:gliding-motility protein MglA [Candidatus Zymogenaceae bacterium]
MRINWTQREMIMKIVYFGPSLGGKTTNLRNIYSQLTPDVKGQFMSINTMEDRTLFFDYFDVSLSARFGKGRIKMRFELYTVPGQVRYEETRRAVMKGADGVVFVADSQKHKMPDNLFSRADLDEILVIHNQNPKTFPTVMQYNKRDLTDLLSVPELTNALNPRGSPEFLSIAINGQQVMDTLKGISTEVIKASREKFL